MAVISTPMLSHTRPPNPKSSNPFWRRGTYVLANALALAIHRAQHLGTHSGVEVALGRRGAVHLLCVWSRGGGGGSERKEGKKAPMEKANANVIGERSPS